MLLSDWLSLAIALIAVSLLCISPKIPYGNVLDHFGTLDKDGKPVPNPWWLRQTRRDRLRRLLLWTIAVGGIGTLVLRKLGL
jgi:hypothetical protein